MFSASTTSAVSSARSTVCLPGTLPWRASFSSASCFMRGDAPTRSWAPLDTSDKQISGCHVLLPWKPRVVSLLSTVVQDLGSDIAILCVTLSPQSRPLLPGILGKDHRIVHLLCHGTSLVELSSQRLRAEPPACASSRRRAAIHDVHFCVSMTSGPPQWDGSRGTRLQHLFTT